VNSGSIQIGETIVVKARKGTESTAVQSHQRRGLLRRSRKGTQPKASAITAPTASPLTESPSHLPSVWFDRS